MGTALAEAPRSGAPRFDGAQRAALDQSLTAGIFEKTTNRSLTNGVLPRTSNPFVGYPNPAWAVGALSTRKLVYRQDIPFDAAKPEKNAGARRVETFETVYPGKAGVGVIKFMAAQASLIFR